MGNVGKYFNRYEFSCKCGCGKNDISEQLVHQLDKVREIIGRPIVITSGCRCPSHNEKVGGKENSSHLKGFAADLKVNNSKQRFEVLQTLFMVGTTRIGIAKTFIHVDLENSKPQRVIWLY